MPLRDLNLADKESGRRVLAYQLARWDWEAPTVLGIQKEEVEGLLARWPVVDDQDEAGAAHRAIHSSLGDLIGLRGIREEDCRSEIGVTPKELAEIFQRWKPEFQARTPLDFLA
jgi:hypothetical protein